MSPLEEQTLIQLARGGDLDAFNHLVEAHQDAVFAMCFRMVRNRAIAEDIAQDAFLSGWRAVRTYRGNSGQDTAVSFKAWLLRIARNATYDHLRRAKRRAEVSIDDDAVTVAHTLPSRQAGPEEQALGEELSRVISEGLGIIPPEQRMAVVLVDIEGYSYEEAATVMEANIGTVKSRLNRGRAKLRDFLQSRPELLPSRFRLADREGDCAGGPV